MKRHILFEELFHNHLDYIAGALRSVGCKDDELEDIIQSAYVRAFEKFDQLKDENSFLSWFTAIAINETFRKKKKDKKYVLFGKPEELSTIVSENEWSDFYIENDMTIRILLEEAMEKIPEEYLVPFKLSVLENYKYREIAVILCIKEGTVKSRINRAKVLLKKILSEEEGDYKKNAKAK